MDTTKKTILVCDDNEDILEVVSRIVKPAGYNVFLAGGYKEVLPLIGSVRPDLLICDIRMPVRDGFWIAEYLQMEGIQIPIIFITAFDTQLYRAYAPFVGSVGFVTKPFEADELLRQIEKALAQPVVSDAPPALEPSDVPAP